MTNAPLLTDRTALVRNRARAMASGAPADFLHQIAILDIQERLETVNRTFTAPAVVTGFPATWHQAFPTATIVSDDDTLALLPGGHDLVIHALALHWANDPVGQLVQCQRALHPDGLFMAILFGGQTLHELRAALAQAETEVTGGLSPRVLPMGEIRDLGALIQRAGLALPVADSFTQTVIYPDMPRLMADLRAMGETNAMEHRLRRPTRRSVFRRAAEIYAAAHATGTGIPASFDFICLTGWAPHDSQQRPLRPGSAQQRLAEALQTAEHPLDKGSLNG